MDIQRQYLPLPCRKRHILAHTDASSSISIQACDSNFVPPRPTRTADGPIFSTCNTCFLVVALLKPVHPTIMETLNIESLYGANISDILTQFTHPIFDIIAWLPYGLIYFVFPFVVAGFLFRAPPITPAISNPHVLTAPHSNLQTHHLHHKLPISHPVVDLTNSPRTSLLGLGPAGEHHHHHQHDHGHIEDDGRSTRLSRRHSAVRLVDEEQEFHILHDHTSIHGASPTVGRKRQIISILVRSFSLRPQTFDLIAILKSSN